MNTPLNIGKPQRRSPMGLILIAVVLLLLGGATLLLLTHNRQKDSYSLGEDGSVTVKRDADGRIEELLLLHPDGHPKLRATMTYSPQDVRIRQFSIYDSAGELVEFHLFERGGVTIGPETRPSNPPFSISGSVEGGIRTWECDGRLLFRDRTTQNTYEQSGPNGVKLFSKKF